MRREVTPSRAVIAVPDSEQQENLNLGCASIIRFLTLAAAFVNNAQIPRNARFAARPVIIEL